ncbi:MAG: hypothetical protein KJO55_01870 [Gammaproteobacteria bacterium]|nr:hypothetical protein [Gammaproteobacteria bacterium]
MLKVFFCDAARSEQGKLHIEGIYNELVAQGFPARHDRLILCGLVEWPHDASGNKEFVVELLDPDDKPVFTVEGHTEIEPRPPDRSPAQTHLIMPLEQVVFPVAGCYRARFSIAGQVTDGAHLYLIES